MSLAAVIVISPRHSAGNRRAPKATAANWVAAAARAGLDEVIVVLADETAIPEFPAEASILLDASGLGTCRALRSALDYAARARHDSVLVAAAAEAADDAVLSDPSSWQSMAQSTHRPFAAGIRNGRRVGLVRLDASVWPLVPLEGNFETLLEAHASAIEEIDLAKSPPGARPAGRRADVPSADRLAVAELLGREPQGDFSVVLRDQAGAPLVIENSPILDDATPMPTRYWLVGRRAVHAVARLESTGGVRAAQAAVDTALLEDSHRRYERARDAAIDPNWTGPRPSGGVGGTHQGVKCLHAHLAWYLVGGKDPVGRWVVDQIGSEIDGPVAAMDCGTNSTRLLVLSAEKRPLAREAIITRLGEGVDETHALAPLAIKRTLEVLRQYRDRCDELGVVAVRASATSAARDASNAKELFEPAHQIVGAPLELLAGPEEGRLSYLGATHGKPGGPHLVVDLGGGSTELIAGSKSDGHGIGAVESMNIGCVRVTERFLKTDPPTEEEIAAARSYVREVIEETLAAHHELCDPPQMIGVAGTVSTLASLEIGLVEYDGDVVDGTTLSREDVERFRDELLGESLAERRSRPAIEEGRADVIGGGALILAEVMAATGHSELVYSESDILDGVALELLDRLRR